MITYTYPPGVDLGCVTRRYSRSRIFSLRAISRTAMRILAYVSFFGSLASEDIDAFV